MTQRIYYNVKNIYFLALSSLALFAGGDADGEKALNINAVIMFFYIYRGNYGYYKMGC